MAPGRRACRTGQIPGRTSGGGVASPRGVGGRTGAVPGERAEIRRPIAGSHPCPTSRHEAREFPGPSHAPPLDPRSSCSGRFRQGLDQRRQGPMPLDPAELALGAAGGPPRTTAAASPRHATASRGPSPAASPRGPTRWDWSSPTSAATPPARPAAPPSASPPILPAGLKPHPG